MSARIYNSSDFSRRPIPESGHAFDPAAEIGWVTLEIAYERWGGQVGPCVVPLHRDEPEPEVQRKAA